ncbi:hypothetical protein [Streptomyces sp. NRRL S-455]|uniref:hypothetical protein n=1 Tax=Streptomyces sp. NRRL S-455 TaxID=1463908 RepID=UPI0004BFBC53|nr:hypothetical protein [Streptomyces sp. NRRL S-455]
MPAGYVAVRVHYEYDTGTWYASGLSTESRARPLRATSRTAAQTETEAALTSLGLSLTGAWSDLGDDETGSRAVFARAGSSQAVKSVLGLFWTTHKELLAKLGVSVPALPAAQRAILFSQDVMLVGLVRALVDKGELTDDDIAAACSAVQAADFSWLTGL